MSYTTLISTEKLAAQIDNNDWAVFDCRFDFDDHEAAYDAYQLAHIPGAIYADLEKSLSGSIIPGKTSRHPLPDIDEFVNTLSAWGIDENVQVVVYDDVSGAYAVRLWWMLRWTGHEKVAVLNGGLQAWEEAGLQLSSGVETRKARTFVSHQRPSMKVSAEDVLQYREMSNKLVVDSRGPDRFRGENETLDPVAGHIPGAINAYFKDNFDEQGRFLPPAILKKRFSQIIGDTSPENVVFYCGSGVTANVNILAMIHAGLGEARLYPGSWSEWITDPERPVTTQEE